MIILWTEFIICTAVIVYAGTRLSKYGDVIAEKTGIGKIWLGMVLLASVTSLPELVTGIAAVTYPQAPDIAVGNILGSCVFNLLILAILDALYRSIPISTKAHYIHILSAGFGIILLGVVSVGLFLGERVAPFGWIGLYSMVILVIYFVAVWLVYLHEKKELAHLLKEKQEESKYIDIDIRTAIVKYSTNAFFVVVAAILLPEIGVEIAATTGLGQTFVGNIFIAVATSLPEVVVSIAAIRIGAIDLAIGNVFGSNMFNIAILAIIDVVFVKGPILSYTNPNNIISAVSAMIMTAVAILGLAYRAEKKTLFLAWDSIVIILLYITNLMILYMIR